MEITRAKLSKVINWVDCGSQSEHTDTHTHTNNVFVCVQLKQSIMHCNSMPNKGRKARLRRWIFVQPSLGRHREAERKKVAARRAVVFSAIFLCGLSAYKLHMRSSV